MNTIKPRLSVTDNHWFLKHISQKLELMPMLPTVVAFVLGIIAYNSVLDSLPTIILLLITVTLLACSFAIVRFTGNGAFRSAVLMIAIFFMGTALTSIHEQRHKVIFPEKAVQIYVVVSDTPKRTDNGFLLEGIVVAPRSSFDGQTVRCYLHDAPYLPSVGQTVMLHGKLSPVKNKSNSNFNYELWAKSHGIAGQVYVYDMSPATTMLGQLGAWNRFCVKARILRRLVLERLSEDVSDGGNHTIDDNEEYVLVAAMAFGERSGIGQDMRDRFASTGASHLLALSGMHLGILYMLLSLFFVRSKRQIAGQVVLLMAIWTYVVIVGMPLSVLRAAIMLTIYSVSEVLSRSKKSVNALCLAAWIMLIVNPVSIWDVGFQMSFMAMVGIFACYDPLYRLIDIEYLFSHGIFNKLWAWVCVSVAAQVTTMPLTVYYFGRLPLMFLLTNLIAIPLVSVLLFLVFLSMLCWFMPVVRVVLVKVCIAFASTLITAITMLSRIDFMSINDISINLWQLMLIYLIIILVALMIVFVCHLKTFNKYRKQMTNRF